MHNVGGMRPCGDPRVYPNCRGRINTWLFEDAISVHLVDTESFGVSLRWHGLKMVPCFQLLSGGKACLLFLEHVPTNVADILARPLLDNIFLQALATHAFIDNRGSTWDHIGIILVIGYSSTDCCNDLCLVLGWELAGAVAELNVTLPGCDDDLLVVDTLTLCLA